MTAPNPSETETVQGAIRAGECPHCQALFLVPGTDAGPILCPGCEQVIDVGSARVRSLLMGRPAPAPPVETEPVTEEVAEEVAEESAADDLTEATPAPEDFGPPAVAVEPPEPEEPNEPEPVTPPAPLEAPFAATPPESLGPPEPVESPEPQPLSDLGTLLGGSALGAAELEANGITIETPAAAEPPAEDPRPLSDALQPETAHDDEDIDDEDDSAIPGGATIDYGDDITLASPDFEVDPSATEDSPVEDTADAPEPIALEYDEDDSELEPEDDEPEDDAEAAIPAETVATPILNRSRDDDPEEEPVGWAPPLVDETGARRWLKPLLATAGLLLIGAPLGYVGWMSANATATSSTPTTTSAREDRVALLDEAEEASGAEEATELPSDTVNGEVIAADATLPEGDKSSVKTASFESTESVYGSRYADQASAEEPAASQPAEEEDPLAEFASLDAIPGDDGPLVGAPLYDVETLVEATSLAAGAGPAFTSGTLDTDEAVAEMGQHYARLCYLAQVLTLLDTGSFDLTLTTVQLEATDVFRKMFRDAEARANSRQIASHWIAWEGRPHGGVFFTGKPDDAGRNGDVFEYRFPLADGDRVYVLTEEKIDPKRFALAGAKEIGVIGVVVEDPATRIRGYKGDQPRVVWARKTIPLRKAPTN